MNNSLHITLHYDVTMYINKWSVSVSTGGVMLVTSRIVCLFIMDIFKCIDILHGYLVTLLQSFIHCFKITSDYCVCRKVKIHFSIHIPMHWKYLHLVYISTVHEALTGGVVENGNEISFSQRRKTWYLTHTSYLF